MPILQGQFNLVIASILLVPAVQGCSTRELATGTAEPGGIMSVKPDTSPAVGATEKRLPTEVPIWEAGNDGENRWGRLEHDLDLIWEDYAHYYTVSNLTALALGIGLAAPIANTSADQSIRRWYQKRIRGETTDEFANFANYGGQFWVALPAALQLAAWSGKFSDDFVADSPLMEWSNRSLRSIFVGTPPMLALYAILGSSRPDRNDSHWHPFQDIHGVSGHTFMGAVPFLTAASMTDDPLVKYPLVLGSMLTGWSRINFDKHYFSQVALGWWMAYLAVRSVNQTEAGCKRLTIGPIFEDGVGVAAQWRY
jgi:hypothetical protein